MAKRRAAFLLKQQKKAEEARMRKQQLEAESELKRDEARYVLVHTQTLHLKVFRLLMNKSCLGEVNIFMKWNWLPLAFISI